MSVFFFIKTSIYNRSELLVWWFVLVQLMAQQVFYGWVPCIFLQVSAQEQHPGFPALLPSGTAFEGYLPEVAGHPTPEYRLSCWTSQPELPEPEVFMPISILRKEPTFTCTVSGWVYLRRQNLTCRSCSVKYLTGCICNAVFKQSNVRPMVQDSDIINLSQCLNTVLEHLA